MAERKKIKPGAKIRNMFARLIKKNCISQEIINSLMDVESTKKEFKIRYPFLRMVKMDEPEVLQIKVNGRNRYTKTPVNINGQKYFITNDIYAKNVPLFKLWYDKMIAAI